MTSRAFATLQNSEKTCCNNSTLWEHSGLLKESGDNLELWTHNKELWKYSRNIATFSNSNNIPTLWKHSRNLATFLTLGDILVM